jgi:hypothetical protein
MATRWARVARGCVAAAVSLFVAAFGHIVSGGPAPTLFALLCCFVVSAFICVVLSGKALSLAKLSVSVALSQLLFHTVFSLWTTQPTGIAPLGHVHGQLFAFVTPDSPLVPTDASKWLAHALAAVVTIAALRHGESAFWGLFGVARLWLTRLWLDSLFAALALVRVGTAPRPLPPLDRILPLRDLVVLHSSRHHRGPPPERTSALVAA